PGGAGLLAVTVVDPDPAMAEVWSKVLFLSGRDGIADKAAVHRLRALWVTTSGLLGMSEDVSTDVIWRAA
ncbi:MAG: ApbE family lipoprotein, partial [Pseudonocardiales bacterium]|nr:ApbE family lipoprotein [Pseudonocardiales bacterium]